MDVSDNYLSSEITIENIYTEVILGSHKCLTNNLLSIRNAYLDPSGFGPYLHVTIVCYQCKRGKNEEGMSMDTDTETNLWTPANKNCVNLRRFTLRRSSLDAISDASDCHLKTNSLKTLRTQYSAPIPPCSCSVLQSSNLQKQRSDVRDTPHA
jgi:hypothetical protein